MRRECPCVRVTFLLIIFFKMSHQLPEPVFARLQAFIWGLEERLQADAHLVGRARDAHEAFDANWVESGLIRAVIASSARPFMGDGLELEDLGNGGVEISHIFGGVERRFRLKKAKRDSRGIPVVTSSSDSVLTLAAREPNLFEESPPQDVEQWVIAYMLHPVTLTFDTVFAGLVVGVLNERSPYRLKLANIVHIPHAAPTPPDFKPGEDDLDLPGEDEGRGEQAG